MFDYFFMFDKAFNEMLNTTTVTTDTIAKRRWYKSIEKEGKKYLLYDVSGVDEKDLSVNFEKVGYEGRITIEGKTETPVGNYSVKDRFIVPANFVGENSTWFVRAGILYVEVVPEKESNFTIKKKETQNF